MDEARPMQRLVGGVIAVLAVVCAAALATAPAAALEVKEPFDAKADPARVLGGTLRIGDDGTWTGAFEDGKYVLSNSAVPGAVRYNHLGGRDGSKPTSVSVDVSGRFDGDAAGAGLLYRYERASKGYFAFVLTADGYTLYKRTANGFRPLSRGSNAAVTPGGENRLTVQLEGSSATLLVNGTRVLGHKSDGPPAGAEVGLIAIDLGIYRFDNFELLTD